jgi:glycosyltransferase involved in cell wall biosynthesis
MHPKLTLAIPFYNGFQLCSKFIASFVNFKLTNVELVISDDGSDVIESTQLLELISSLKCPSILLVKSNINLGMDWNFNQCVEVSRGDFVWFFGQDDYTTLDCINFVLSLLECNPDVLFLNYQILRSHKKFEVFNKFAGSSVCAGYGLNHFLRSTNFELPSFLPSLLIKRSSWSHPYPEFNGTGFIQLGNAICAIKKGNWIFSKKVCSYGVIPDYGWQSNPAKSIYFFYGYINILFSTIFEREFFFERNLLIALRSREYISLLYDQSIGYDKNNLLFKLSKQHIIFHYLYYLRFISSPIIKLLRKIRVI